MFTKYCHQVFPEGLTCEHRSSGGVCSAGLLCDCNYRESFPPITNHLRVNPPTSGSNAVKPNPQYIPPASVSISAKNKVLSILHNKLINVKNSNESKSEITSKVELLTDLIVEVSLTVSD